MKFASTLFFALFAAAKANNLRAARRLEDGIDADPVNNAVDRTLTVVNTALAKAITDPLTVGQSQTQTYSPSCGTVTGVFEIATLEGGSSLQFDEIVLLEDGSEEYSGDCLNVQGSFSGNFSFALSAKELVAAGSLDVSGDTGSTCDTYASDVDLVITNLAYTGIMYLEGRIALGVAALTEVEIKTIEGTCDSAVATFANQPVPADYTDIEAQIKSASQDEMKAYLAEDMADFLKDKINGLDGVEADLGFAGGVPLIAALFQAGVQKRINNMVGATQAQINAINENANKQIAEMSARVNNGVDGAEKAVSSRANGLASGISERLNSWGTGAENFIGRLGFQIDP